MQHLTCVAYGGQKEVFSINSRREVEVASVEDGREVDARVRESTGSGREHGVA